MSSWLRKYDRNPKLIVTSTQLEYESLFDEEYIFASNMVERAIDESKVAQALLYMAMNIIAAWRNTDNCRDTQLYRRSGGVQDTGSYRDG